MIFYTDKVSDSMKNQIASFPLIRSERPKENINKDAYFLVALIQDIVVGYILLEKPVDDSPFNIQYLEILEEHRNKGVGSNLIKRVIEYVIKNGGSKITLMSTNNSCKFFEKFGFRGDLLMEFNMDDK